MFNEKRTFGIEIELVHSNSRAMAAALKAAGIPTEVEGYNHQTRNHWKIVMDSSIRGGGYELVSPILRGEAGLETVRIVAEVLKAQGAQVNQSCGFHVHHDAADLKDNHFENLFRLYRRSETVIDRMMPKSRRANNNRFCGSLRDLPTIPGSRYYKVNFAAYHVHGTVEFRQHSGTIEAEKMIQWIRISQAIIERSKRRVTEGPDLNYYDFFQAIGLIHNTTETEQSTRQYIENRMAALAAS